MMKYAQVTVVLVALVGYGIAAGYGSGSGSSGYGGGAGGGGGAGYSGGASSGRTLSSGGGAAGAPQPYKFDYNAADEQGNAHYRQEEGDAKGAVRGTYGYTDTQGLYRVVEYVADENGFRAKIKTNEPGTDGKESPADVDMTVDQPPSGLGGQGSGGAGGYKAGGLKAGSGAGASYGGSSGGGRIGGASGKSGY